MVPDAELQADVNLFLKKRQARGLTVFTAAGTDRHH